MIAAVIGATGQTGELLVNRLLKDPLFQQVRILVRNPIQSTAPQLECIPVDFGDSSALKKALSGVEVLFCCIGTTLRKVRGNKVLYRSIDLEIPVLVATLGQQLGCRQFVLMSSVGADPAARNFYLKLKGETELALSAIGLESLHIMQPSMLLGKRKEPRLAEAVAKVLMKWTAPLFAGPLKKYRPIEADRVAAAMIAVVKSKMPGIHRYTYGDIMQWANELLPG